MNVQKLLQLSDWIHELEASGVEVTKKAAEGWQELTAVIETASGRG